MSLLGRLALLLIVLLALAYGLSIPYTLYRQEIWKLVKWAEPEIIKFPITQKLSNRLGTFRKPLDSKIDPTSFWNRSPQKAKGIFRIGTFGDSYTYGDEVSVEFNFPNLLQKELKRRGYPRVEIVNFGQSWWGFHQSFIFWSEMEKTYQLDAAIFGPGSMFPERETSFNHTLDHVPAYLHSRFVKKKEGAWVEVAPIGETREERIESYYSLWPQKIYRSYDRNPPAFFKAFWPRGRQYKNYFYYRKDSALSEANESYQYLIEKIAARGKPWVFASGDNSSNFSTLVEKLGGAPGSIDCGRIIPEHFTLFRHIEMDRDIRKWRNFLQIC